MDAAAAPPRFDWPLAYEAEKLLRSLRRRRIVADSAGSVARVPFAFLVDSVPAVAGVTARFVMPLVAFGQDEIVVRQPGAVYDFDFKSEKRVLAPRRDISPQRARPASNCSRRAAS